MQGVAVRGSPARNVTLMLTFEDKKDIRGLICPTRLQHIARESSQPERGTRLQPATVAISEQLLPEYANP